VVDLHAGHGPVWLSWPGAGLAAIAIVGYLVLVLTSQRPWPRHRTVLWVSGCCVAGTAASAPLTAAAEGDFVAHMTVHLLLGMVAPLLLVLAAPITVLLRALPVGMARRLSRLLRSPPARFLTEPSVAAILSVGGLWLLYTTDLYAGTHRLPALHLLVHAHMFLTGWLFTVALIGVDPLPHRRSFLHRSLVLVLAWAAHDVLAKYVYAHPPLGVTAPAAETGGMLMFYGGDIVEVTIAIVLCSRWFRARSRSSEATRSAVMSDRVPRRLVPARIWFRRPSSGVLRTGPK
jgi:putative membrane protein